MLRGDQQRTEPLKIEYVIDRWADTIKLIGGGNSAGLFASGVALYYFAGKPYPVGLIFKLSAGTYFVGLLFFVAAYTALVAYMNFVDFYLSEGRPDKGKRPFETAYSVLSFCAIISFIIWLLASLTIMAAVVVL